MSTTPQFAIPDEMRALAERSVEQAKVAFQQLMQAAEEAVSTLDERSETSQVVSAVSTLRQIGWVEEGRISGSS